MKLNFGLGIKFAGKYGGTSAFLVLALAAGMGLAGAALSLSYGILGRPLSFQDPSRLVWMWSSSIRRGAGTGAVSMADFLDYRAQSGSFEQLSAFVPWPFQIAGSGGAEAVGGARVTWELPVTLGIKPAIGRLFQASESEPGKEKVVILGDALWRRSFGADAGIAGKTVRISGEAYTVVGVLPPGVEFPPQSELWTPLALQPAENASRRFRALRPVGRLKTSAVLSDVQLELEMIARRLEIKYPGTNFDVGVKLVPLQEILGGGLANNLLGLSAAAFVLLALALANVASLAALRARWEGGAGDPAQTTAGVNAWVLAVSLAGAVAGGVGTGVFLAFLNQLGPSKVIRLSDIRFDGITVGFLALSALVAFLIAGGVSRRAMSRGSGGGFEITRSVFAALQAAIAFAAVAAAVFAARGVAQYASTNPGFRPENLATMQIIAPPAKYSGAPKRLALVESLLQKIRGMPGVEMAGGTSELALSGQSNDVLFLIDGRSPVAPGGRPSYAGLRIVTPDYFKAMGVPLVKGRLFEPGDAGKPNVVLISDVLEREYFFLDDPLGKQVVIDLGEKWTGQIAGVVGSIRHANLGAAPAREIYISNFQRPTGGLNLVVKTRQGADLNALRTSITEQVKTMDPEIPVAQFRTMEAVIADSVAQARLFAMIVETAAGAAVLMSALAFYALAGSLAAGRSKAAFSQPFLRGAASAVAGFAIGFGLWQWLAGSLPAVTASLDKGGTLSAVVALSVMAVVGAASLFLGGRGTIQRRA